MPARQQWRTPNRAAIAGYEGRESCFASLRERIVKFESHLSLLCLSCRAGMLRDERHRVLRNHQFLVGGDDVDRQSAVFV